MIMNNLTNKKSVPNDNNNSDGKEKEKENKNKNEKDSNRIFNKEEKDNNRIFDKFEEPKVSLFENWFSETHTKEIMITRFLFPPKKYKEQIDAYRLCFDIEKRKKIKQSLCCITPSGIFPQRKQVSFTTNSKLICIDLDSKDNSGFDLDKAKHIIGQHFPSLYYAGLSVGGVGIFMLFRISNPEYHRRHFEALEYRLNKKFGLIVDTVVKSPISMRVISYDENPYFNPNPVPFEHLMDASENKSAGIARTVTEKNDIQEKVKRAVTIIWENKIDITNRYEHWFKIGCALAHEFGEDGRQFYTMVSRMCEKFGEGDCDYQYSVCLKYKKETGATIATFFYYCNMYGIRYWDKRIDVNRKYFYK